MTNYHELVIINMCHQDYLLENFQKQIIVKLAYVSYLSRSICIQKSRKIKEIFSEEKSEMYVCVCVYIYHIFIQINNICAPLTDYTENDDIASVRMKRL
jgi:hypothetical protein